MVDNYIGKKETAKINRRVNKEIAPEVATFHTDGEGGPITRPKGGR